MRLPWQARTYERTCSNCGTTWQVPRQFARRRLQGISAWNVAEQSRRPIIRGGPGDAVDWTELNTEVQASEAVTEQSAAFRVCPKCGSDSYTQRPARS
jgi:rRNA maturation protein Nop10